MAGLGDLLAAFGVGALRGGIQRRERHYAEDDQHRRDAEMLERFNAGRLQDLTRDPLFRAQDKEAQRAQMGAIKPLAGKYGASYFLPGDDLSNPAGLPNAPAYTPGSATGEETPERLSGTESFTNPFGSTPRPGLAIAGGNRRMYDAPPPSAIMPAYTNPQKPVDPSKMFTQNNTLQKTLMALPADQQGPAVKAAQKHGLLPDWPTDATGEPLFLSPAPRLAPPKSQEEIDYFKARALGATQTTRDNYLKGEQGGFDALGKAPKPQQIAAVRDANPFRERLGLPPLALPGDKIGENVVPRPKLQGPPTVEQTAALASGNVPNNMTIVGESSPPPKRFDVTATFPLSPEYQKQQAANALAVQKQKDETAYHNDVLKAQFGDKAAARRVEIYKANLSAKTAGANRAVTVRGQDLNHTDRQNALKYQMSKPTTAPGQVTPRDVSTTQHGDRVRINGQVQKWAAERDKAADVIANHQAILKGGVNVETGNALTDGETAFLKAEMGNASETAKRLQSSIDQAKKSPAWTGRTSAPARSMFSTPAQPAPNGTLRHPSTGRFLSPSATPKGKRTTFYKGRSFTVEVA